MRDRAIVALLSQGFKYSAISVLRWCCVTSDCSEVRWHEPVPGDPGWQTLQPHVAEALRHYRSTDRCWSPTSTGSEAELPVFPRSILESKRPLSAAAIRDVERRARARANTAQPMHGAELTKLKRLYRDGKAIPCIAEALGVSQELVRSTIRWLASRKRKRDRVELALLRKRRREAQQRESGTRRGRPPTEAEFDPAEIQAFLNEGLGARAVLRRANSIRRPDGKPVTLRTVDGILRALREQEQALRFPPAAWLPGGVPAW
jgi:hypothetical protein